MRGGRGRGGWGGCRVGLLALGSARSCARGGTVLSRGGRAPRRCQWTWAALVCLCGAAPALSPRRPATIVPAPPPLPPVPLPLSLHFPPPCAAPTPPTPIPSCLSPSHRLAVATPRRRAARGQPPPVPTLGQTGPATAAATAAATVAVVAAVGALAVVTAGVPPPVPPRAARADSGWVRCAAKRGAIDAAARRRGGGGGGVPRGSWRRRWQVPAPSMEKAVASAAADNRERMETARRAQGLPPPTTTGAGTSAHHDRRPVVV